MLINNLVLKNYRNYSDLNVNFNKGLNIFIGDNAQGKTNILESIYVLAVTKSYLGVNDKDLIKFDNSCSLIKSSVLLDNINTILEVKINNNGKKVFINGKEIKKFRDYISKFNVIIFSPDNIRMIKDGPSARRRFLNVEISQIFNKYVSLMNDFNCILKQRNEVLKGDNINTLYLDVINDKFSSLAVDITIQRKKFLEKINERIGNIFYDISGISGLEVRYISNVDIFDDVNIMRDNVLNRIKSLFDREKKYGSTLIGPQRDDFYFFIGDKNISIYGSQGQMRMAILSLKLSEIEVFKEYTGNYPILLLDDIFSELDVIKRNNLIKYISFNIQTIITTTDLNMIDDSLISDATIYRICDGKIVSEGEDEI